MKSKKAIEYLRDKTPICVAIGGCAVALAEEEYRSHAVKAFEETLENFIRDEDCHQFDAVVDLFITILDERE